MGVIIIVIVVLLVYILAEAGKSPEKPPKPKEDPDKKTQENIAIQILTKKTTPEAIADKDGYDIEHIKQWVQDYIDYAVKYSLDADKTNAHIDQLIDDIAFLKEVCHKYIGDDWEEKTDYQNRTRSKYK